MKTAYLSLPALVLLAACGGGGGAGPQTITGATVGAVGLGSGGLGGTPATTTAATGPAHTFVAPTVVKTYSATSALQSFNYKVDDTDTRQQYAQLYAANASSVRSPTTTIAYDPRDAIFTLTVKDTAANIDNTVRFQDPAHRTDFAGNITPSFGTPNLTSDSVLYLEVSTATGGAQTGASNTRLPDAGATVPSGTDVSGLFYQRPGASTRYVTFAGYVRNKVDIARITPNGAAAYLETSYKLERGVFVYGEQTARPDVPITGSGTFTGAFLATMIDNPTLDGIVAAAQPSYFQWIAGASTVGVNFGTGAVTVALTGTAGAPFRDNHTFGTTFVPGGAAFTAAGTGRIDLVGTGGFTGSFQSAGFTWATGSQTLSIAGSSLDGTFYGPGAAEVGASLRIVGGTPDQRVDILGALTGAR